MPQFHYTALSQNGALVVGESAAASMEVLKAELEDSGLHVQRIRAKREWMKVWQRGRVRTEAFMQLVQELHSLMRAGLPLPEALAIAADRPGEPVLARVLTRVLKDVKEGALLSQACASHPEIFDSLFLAAVRTGEKTGEMPAVLARHMDYLQRKVALGKKVSQALAYPLFLMVALTVILGVMFAFVMPRFVSMYAHFDAKLPLPPRVLLSAVAHLPLIATVAVALVAAGGYVWRSFVARPEGRLKIDEWKMRVPLVGNAVRTAAIAQLARSLATLLAGGTSLVEALQIAQESFPNRAYAAKVGRVAASVTQGESLAKAVRAVDLMPNTAVKMLQVGEASGGLDGILADIALYYEEALEARLARIMALIEPALMLLMGVMIGGIIIVMYLPIFNLAAVIR